MNTKQAKAELDEAKAEYQRIREIHAAALKEYRFAKIRYQECRRLYPDRTPRAQAIADKAKTYISERKCKRCGVAGLRYTIGKSCVACNKPRIQEYREKRKAREAEELQARLTDGHPLSQAWGMPNQAS